MIRKISNILSGAQSAVVQSMKNTQKLLDKVQAKLASGKDVNSAIDNPNNFFLSLSLSQKADDLGRLLDAIAQNIEVIKTASAGADAILKIIDTIDALLEEAAIELYSGTETSLVSSLSASDIAAIVAANPGVAYSPDSQSFYRLSAAPAPWATANTIAQSSTLIEPPGVIGVDGVTGHLAVITSLLENTFVDGMAAGNLWLGGSDAGVEGEWRWVTGPESGQQFWQGTAAGSTVGGMFARWGGGEPNNSGNEDHVHMRGDGFWNDQSGASVYNYVIEWDASLFVTVKDQSLVDRAGEYADRYLELLEQVDLLAKDAHYRGINLLKEDNLRTNFNVNLTRNLITEGINSTSEGLGLIRHDFLRLSTLDLAKEKVRDARNEVRSYGNSLANDLNIITIRQNYTRESINTHKSGATDLTMADDNESGAELLALQVRQQLQTQGLQTLSEPNILRLF